MPGPGTGPRPGGWETLAYGTQHESCFGTILHPAARG